MNIRFRAAMQPLAVVCALAFAMPGQAQVTDDYSGPQPAHVAYVDGSATLVRDGQAEIAAAGVPLVAGDQVSTQQGRVEVLFGDGSVLDLDEFSSVDFRSDDLLRLLAGRVWLAVGGRDRVSYRIDTPAGAVRIDTPGEYRIALMGAEGGRLDVELVTSRGFATLVNDNGETGVRAGERAFATASMAPSYARAFNSAAWDEFDRWAADRRDARTGTLSVQYLPDDVRGYAGAFDRYGDWRYEVEYGYVWYPRVHVEWRPYYHGRWHHYGHWGWTWITYDPWWGWPTHHYGRWGFSAGAWFWIPSRRWGPAHVYWASAPGYVGWCPRGWNGGPVIGLHAGVRGGRYHDPYRAWTVVPRRAFGSRRDVTQYAVARSAVSRAVPRWSVGSSAAPVQPRATGRGATPIYSAGRSQAVGRDRLPASRSATGAGVPVEATSQRYRAVERSNPAASRPGAGVPVQSGSRSRVERVNPAAPRAAAPPAPGVLASPAAGVRDPGTRAVPRARYRDLGPGGSDAPRPSPVTRTPDRPSGYASPERAGGQPRVYAPRQTPGGDAPSRSPYGVPRQRSGVYSPGQRDGGPAPAPRSAVPRGVPRGPSGVGRPGGSDGPRPNPSAAPSRPSGGARPSRGTPSRAVPRGSAPAGGSSRPSSGTGQHSRTPR